MRSRVIYSIIALVLLVVLSVQWHWNRRPDRRHELSTPQLNAYDMKVDLDIPFDHESFGPDLPAQ